MSLKSLFVDSSSNCIVPTTLNTIVVSNLNVGDLSFLSNNTSITGLILDNCGVGDLSFVSGMTSLSVLSLKGASITDLRYLENMTSLTYLNLMNDTALSEPYYLTGSSTPHYSMQILVDLNPNSTSSTKKNGNLVNLYLSGCSGLSKGDKAKLNTTSWVDHNGF